MFCLGQREHGTTRGGGRNPSSGQCEGLQWGQIRGTQRHRRLRSKNGGPRACGSSQARCSGDSGEAAHVYRREVARPLREPVPRVARRGVQRQRVPDAPPELPNDRQKQSPGIVLTPGHRGHDWRRARRPLISLVHQGAWSCQDLGRRASPRPPLPADGPCAATSRRSGRRCSHRTAQWPIAGAAAPPPSDRLPTASHLLGRLHGWLMPVRIEHRFCTGKRRVSQGGGVDGGRGGGWDAPRRAARPWIPAFAGMTAGRCGNDGCAKVSN